MIITINQRNGCSSIIRVPYRKNRSNQIEASVNEAYSFYAGFDGTTGEQASGAYIFRPNGSQPIIAQEKNITVLRESIYDHVIYDEVHQKINPWIYQNVPPAVLVRFLREHRSEWADFNVDAYSAASVKANPYSYLGMRPTRFTSG